MVLMQKINTEGRCRETDGPVGLTDLSLVIPPEARSLSAISLPFATVKTASARHEPKKQAVQYSMQQAKGRSYHGKCERCRHGEREREGERAVGETRTAKQTACGDSAHA